MDLWSCLRIIKAMNDQLVNVKNTHYCIKILLSLFFPVSYSRQEERARAKAKRETAKVIFSQILILYPDVFSLQ